MCWLWHPWYRRGWWGPAGFRAGYRHGFHRGYHHGYRRGAQAGYRAGYRAGQRQGHSNMYRNRSTGVRHTGQSPAQRQSSQMRKSNQANNVYADRSGNVHRNSGNEWQSRQGNSWQSGGGGSERAGSAGPISSFRTAIGPASSLMRVDSMAINLPSGVGCA